MRYTNIVGLSTAPGKRPKCFASARQRGNTEMKEGLKERQNYNSSNAGEKVTLNRKEHKSKQVFTLFFLLEKKQQGKTIPEDHFDLQGLKAKRAK